MVPTVGVKGEANTSLQRNKLPRTQASTATIRIRIDSSKIDNHTPPYGRITPS
jgi:hypothetical protein